MLVLLFLLSPVPVSLLLSVSLVYTVLKNRFEFWLPTLSPRFLPIVIQTSINNNENTIKIAIFSFYIRLFS